MQSFKQEVRRQAILLGLGLVLMIAFIIYEGVSWRDIQVDSTHYLFLAAALFYPLGIVYGWRELIDSVNYVSRLSFSIGDDSIFGLIINLALLVLGVFFVILLGWVFGVVKAVVCLITLYPNNNEGDIEDDL